MRISSGLLFSQVTFLALAQDSTTYSVKTPPLTTNWTYEVGTNPWPEYPRPQLQRAECEAFQQYNLSKMTSLCMAIEQNSLVFEYDFANVHYYQGKILMGSGDMKMRLA